MAAQVALFIGRRSSGIVFCPASGLAGGAETRWARQSWARLAPRADSGGRWRAELGGRPELLGAQLGAGCGPWWAALSFGGRPFGRRRPRWLVEGRPSGGAPFGRCNCASRSGGDKLDCASIFLAAWPKRQTGAGPPKQLGANVRPSLALLAWLGASLVAAKLAGQSPAATGSHWGGEAANDN